MKSHSVDGMCFIKQFGNFNLCLTYFKKSLGDYNFTQNTLLPLGLEDKIESLLRKFSATREALVSF